MTFHSLALDSRIIREACGRFTDADQTSVDVGLYLPCYLVQDAPHRRVLCAVIELITDAYSPLSAAPMAACC